MRKFLREHLQLMELLICILFFMAGSLMAVSLFLRASQVEERSQELQSAVNAAQQQAELLRISDVLTEPHLYYDAGWQPCDADNAVYRLDISSQNEHVLSLSVYRLTHEEAELIYSMETGGRL